MTTMPEYLCLLYSEDADEAEREARWAELPRWHALTDRMREAGVWVANNPLHGVEAATTVRVRDDDVQLTDGPFATTKEVLAGYYLLRCRDLDEAVRWAAQLPIAEYGSVEVRPVADLGG
jgi:hypothetical protein